MAKTKDEEKDTEIVTDAARPAAKAKKEDDLASAAVVAKPAAPAWKPPSTTFSTPVKASEYHPAGPLAPGDYKPRKFEVMKDREMHFPGGHKVKMHTGRIVSEQNMDIKHLLRSGVDLKWLDPKEDAAEN